MASNIIFAIVKIVHYLWKIISPKGQSTAVVLRNVTDEEKRLLFNQSTASLASEEQVQRLLEEVKRLNPNEPDIFGIKEDAISRLEFNVLRSTATSPSVPVKSYIILSYCWKNENDDWKKIVDIDCKPWPFPPVMVQKILSLRQSQDEGVWFDYECIDQNDENKKKDAIGSMDIIYHRARRLVIILEDVQLTKAEAALVKRLNKNFKKGRILSYRQPEMHHASSLFEKFISSRWASRAWCLHEFRVSPLFSYNLVPENQTAVLVYDHLQRVVDFTPWVLSWAANSWVSLNMQPHNLGTPQENDTRPIKSSKWTQLVSCSLMQQNTLKQELFSLPLNETDTATEQKRRIWENGRNIRHDSVQDQLSIVFQYDIAFSRNCFYKKDRLSIACNFSGLGIYYPGGEISELLCYYNFAKLALAAGEVGVLSLNGTRVVLADSAGENKFSWLYRPASSQDEIRYPVFGDSSTIHLVTLEFIELDLLIFKAKPELSSMTGLRKASKFFQDIGVEGDFRPIERSQFLLENLRTMGYDTKDKILAYANSLKAAPLRSPDTVHLHRAMLDLFACIYDCGISWMESVFETIQSLPEVFTPTASTSAQNFNSQKLEDAAVEFLDRMERETCQPDASQPDTQQQDTRLPNAIKLLQLFTQTTLITRSGVAPASIVTDSCGTRAMVKLDSVQDIEDYVVAIPVALAGTRCFNNGWLLQRCQGEQDDPNCKTNTSDDCWKLVGKTHVLGDYPITGNDDQVILQRRQRVYG